MINVIVYAMGDYTSLPNGGEVILLNNLFTANNSNTIKYYLVGMSFNKTEKVGKWRKKKIGDKIYDFFPVTQVLIDKEKSKIPFRIRMVYGIQKYWKEINRISADYYYIHSAELALPMRKNEKTRLVYHVHGDPCQTMRISRFPIFRSEIFTNIYWKIIARTVNASFKIIWAADRSKQLYIEQQPHMTEVVNRKSITIHSSFDSKLVVNKKSIIELPNRKHIITVGRLSRVKRMDFLIDVLSELIREDIDVDLVICGDGEEKKALEIKSKELGIAGRVMFLGLLNREQIATALSESDVFAFASENEAMSLVVLESLYMGLPVVSTDVGDIPYVVKDNETGYIVNGYDVRQFANKIKMVITNGKPHYAEKCINMAKEYTPQNMAFAIEQVFTDDLK